MNQQAIRRPYLNTLRPAAWLLAVGLALAAPGSRAGQEISAAEQRVFVDPHLDNMPATATLRYAYSKTEAGRPPVDDEVVLNTRQDGSRGRVVQVDYLHGDRHLDLPEVAQATANPVILYFLEHDVRGMRQRLGGKENYFRRRIRLALAEATLQPVTIDYAGQRLAATQVVVRPFADDPLAGRLQGADRKTYQFTLSDLVPSGVYELRTVVADPAGSATPLIEESLTLRPGVDSASIEKRKTL